jgi:glycerol dehydrogenase-like iron-containing ADH family enzyme
MFRKGDKQVMQTAMRNNAGIICRAGGGKVIDTAKIVADR